MSSERWKQENQEKMRQYRREWYARNSGHAKAKVVERKREISEWLRDYKRSVKAECEMCGESHPAALDFHHRDPSEKETNLASVVGKGWSRDRIIREINKCDVICSNCHRKLHWNDGV